MMCEYRIKVSCILSRRIQRVSKTLGVSQKNLLIFLMCNTYDKLCAETDQRQFQMINESLKKYNQEKKKAEASAENYKKNEKKQTSRDRNQDNAINMLNFRVNEFIDDIVQKLAEKHCKTKSEIVIACIHNSLDVIEYILYEYNATSQILENKKEYTFKKDKENVLSYTGISPKDFARLSEAFVLYQLLENMFSEIRNRADFFDDLEDKEL